jgi:hypothetical protein
MRRRRQRVPVAVKRSIRRGPATVVIQNPVRVVWQVHATQAQAIRQAISPFRIAARHRGGAILPAVAAVQNCAVNVHVRPRAVANGQVRTKARPI